MVRCSYTYFLDSSVCFSFVPVEILPYHEGSKIPECIANRHFLSGWTFPIPVLTQQHLIYVISERGTSASARFNKRISFDEQAHLLASIRASTWIYAHQHAHLLTLKHASPFINTRIYNHLLESGRASTSIYTRISMHQQAHFGALP